MPESPSRISPPVGNGSGREAPVDPGEFLRGLPPFDRLGDARSARAERALEIVFVARGEYAMRRSDPTNEHLYVIRKGTLRLEVEGRSVDLLEPGDLFGFPSLIAGTSPHFDVVAEDESLLLRLPKDVFDDLMEEAGFASFFLQGLHERLRHAVEAERPLLGSDLAEPSGSLVMRPPVWISVEASVGDAARAMSQHRVSSVLVDTSPPGILTDRDLRNRVLARGLSADTLIAKVMTRPLHVLPSTAPMFEMLVLMLEERVHHVPLSSGGEIIGVVTDTDLLRRHLKSPFHLLKEIERGVGDEVLRGYTDRLAGLVESMSLSGLKAAQIGKVVATLNDAVVSRILRHAEEQLGPPPCPYAWIVFGSEGRREQAMPTDQDNALIYGAEGASAERYFAALADAVVCALVEAGFPRCDGGFMATSWRRPLSGWCELFRGWIEEPRPEALLEAANFFDYRKVHGALSLAPLIEVERSSAENRIFLAHLLKAGLRFRPPLGLFRNLKEEEGGIDLKKGGLLPIVSLARVSALEAGSDVRGTCERLAAAAAAEVLSRDGAESMCEAFRFLFRLRLQRQLECRRAGLPVTNSVPLESLSALERRHLKDTFVAIRRLQEALEQRFSVDALG